MAQDDPTSHENSSAAKVGRRGWFKQAGAAAAGLALGTKLEASNQENLVAPTKIGETSFEHSNHAVTRRRGIDCAFDEGPV